jgi:hypothetical protein
MPYVVRPRQLRRIVVALLGSALLVGAVPAAASASLGSLFGGSGSGSSSSSSSSNSGSSSSSSSGSSGSGSSSGGSCATGAVSTPFSKFKDTASYTPLSGGSFESGTAGWSLTGSSVVSGNERYNVAGGSHSLEIKPTGVAVSPSFCINTTEPSFRFFAKQTSGSWAVLNVILLWTESSGVTHETTVGSLQTGTSWEASPIEQLATTLPLSNSSSTINARLEFKPEQYGGAWAIDDVYIDPHSR